MRKDRRFFIGMTGVAAVVGYLMWTGISDTMVYYLTPAELLAKVESDASYHDVGVKVSGRVSTGSHHTVPGQALHHRFVVEDLDQPEMNFPTEYQGILPDTFVDEVEVVMEGRFRPDGVFEAKLVLTKCGSRYEAMPEDGNVALGSASGGSSG
jgi:cytochrome c-type biogenesis protein CcmE